MDTPTHCRQCGDGRSDQFGGKQISKSGGWDQEEGQLDEPKQEIAAFCQIICSDLVEKCTDLIIPFVSIP